MIVSQDLIIRTGADGFLRLRELLLESVAPPWRHDPVEESEIRAQAPDRDVIAFRREAGNGVEATGLALWTTGDAYVVVGNGPGAVSELEHLSYNAMLMDFVARVIEPASKLATAEFRLTASEISLQDWLSEKAISALHRFAAISDKEVGYGHFSGNDYWYEFLITAHKGTSRFKTQHLVNWLVNQEAWLEENTHEFAGDYAFGLALLGRYDLDRD